MDYKEYINLIISNGLLCEEYQKKLSASHSKKKIFELISDSNGVSYFQELGAKGYDVPYELIVEFFKSYINGRYKPAFYSETEEGYSGEYTSAVYCGYDGEILTDTTQLSILNCHCKITVPEGQYASVYIDGNSSVDMDIIGFGANVYVYGNASFNILKGKEKTKLYVK